MDANEKWYSVKEVAAHLEVDPETVRRWILDGELEAFEFPCRSSRRPRIYISRRISRTELLRFIKSRMTERIERKRRRAA
jgi:excisionase family DNA binding protein